MPRRLAKRLLLVGWDAADWKIIDPLMDAGEMPALQSLVDRGVMGNLLTLQPILSPMLWTTIATGFRPAEHGILGFTEPAPDGQGIRRVTSTSRRRRALWNILSRAGIESQVVAWFGSHPAEPIRGVCVSERFRDVHGTREEPGSPTPGSVHPASLEAALAGLRIHIEELGGPELLPFIPRAHEIDQEKERQLEGLGRILAENASVHNVATFLMQEHPWEFASVYYDLPDHACHGFMLFHPPQLPGISNREFGLFRDVVANCYRYADMMLARLLELAGSGTTVMIVSDHGFHSDHLRPAMRDWDRRGDWPVNCHRDFGVFVLAGPGIRHDERIYGATLLDVAPTVLQLFGLPIGEDMPGRVLTECFEEPCSVETIPSWEQVEGDFGEHPPDLQADPFEEQAALQRLVDLGYVEAPGEDLKKALDRCQRDRLYNLARSQLDARRFRKAAEAFEGLLALEPDQSQVALHLAMCRLQLGEHQPARELIDRVLADDRNAPRADYLMGQLLLAERRPDEALVHLERAEEAEPRLPRLPTRLGDTYLALGRPADAERCYRKALAVDCEATQALVGLARACFAQKRFEEAASVALEAVGLRHLQPRGHWVLAAALARLGRPREARQAIETCLQQAPDLPEAHELLARLLQRAFADPLGAAQHRQRARHLREARSRMAPSA